MAPCNCGSKRLASASTKWEHVGTDGKVKATYSSRTDAQMAAARAGGTVRQAK